MKNFIGGVLSILAAHVLGKTYIPLSLARASPFNLDGLDLLSSPRLGVVDAYLGLDLEVVIFRGVRHVVPLQLQPLPFSTGGQQEYMYPA